MRRRKLITILALALLSGVVLAAAACGGGGSGEKSAATTEAAATTAEKTTAEETTAEETTATTEAEAMTEATEEESSDVSRLFTSEKCRDLAEQAAKVSQAFTGSGGTDLQEAVKFYDELAEQAPEELRADLRVLADAMRKYAEALEGVDLSKAPSADVIAKLQKLSTEIDQAQLTKASENIQAWVEENCT